MEAGDVGAAIVNGLGLAVVAFIAHEILHWIKDTRDGK